MRESLANKTEKYFTYFFLTGLLPIYSSSLRLEISGLTIGRQYDHDWSLAGNVFQFLIVADSELTAGSYLYYPDRVDSI